MSETTSGALPAAIGMEEGTRRTCLAQLFYNPEDPFQIYLGYTKGSNWTATKDNFRVVAVVGRDVLDELLNRRENVANVRLSWGHIAFRIRDSLDLFIETWLVEMFLESCYRVVPRGYECEFAIQEELDDDDDVVAIDWEHFGQQLMFACEVELAGAQNWDQAMSELAGSTVED